jgi:hypothetical protein
MLELDFIELKRAWLELCIDVWCALADIEHAPAWWERFANDVLLGLASRVDELEGRKTALLDTLGKNGGWDE